MRMWGLILGGPVLVLVGYFTVPMGMFGPRHPVVSWLTFGAVLTVVAALLLQQIQRELIGAPGRPGLTILLLSSVALVVFAATYLALSRDGQFVGLRTRVDALYFTVITLATVGYGDVVPAGQEARAVVMLQILYSLVFLTAGATAVSRRLRGRIAERARQGPHRGGQG